VSFLLMKIFPHSSECGAPASNKIRAKTFKARCAWGIQKGKNRWPLSLTVQTEEGTKTMNKLKRYMRQFFDGNISSFVSFCYIIFQTQSWFRLYVSKLDIL